MKTLPISLLLLALAQSATAGETVVIPISEVPANIMAAARKAAPTAKFTKADVETEEDGTRVYELMGTEPEFAFETVPHNVDAIDIDALNDDGFGLQLSKVILKNVQVEVDLLENLEVEEIERIIPARLVPGMVIKRIKNAYPDFQAETVEASYNAAGKIFKYEFAGHGAGKLLDLEVSADGSKIEEADE